MIKTKNDLAEYIQADAAANGRKSTKAALFGDEIWKFLLSLRRLEYCSNQSGMLGRILIPLRLLHQYRYHRLSVLLNFTIPVNVADKGLAIVHYGSIIVSKGARIGQNCRIHEGVTIGATNGSRKAATIGNNVFLATGAKVIGDVIIADDVAIAANAVVTESILEKGTTWGGIPARKISDHDSSLNLCRNRL